MVGKQESWKSGMLTKWQVDRMASWQNNMLSDKMASFQNGKLTKWQTEMWQVDEMANSKMSKW